MRTSAWRLAKALHTPLKRWEAVHAALGRTAPSDCSHARIAALDSDSARLAGGCGGFWVLRHIAGDGRPDVAGAGGDGAAGRGREAARGCEQATRGCAGRLVAFGLRRACVCMRGWLV